MIVSIAVLILSLLILLKASEILIDTSVSIAKFAGFSQFFIGTTLVALGTSLPELASSVFAAITNHTGIVVGNIIGSNVTNITLVLGIASVLIAMNLKRDYFKNKINILIAISILFFILSLDQQINWVEGILFLVIFIWYIRKERKECPGSESSKVENLIKDLFGNKKSLKELTKEDKEILKGVNYSAYKKLKIKGIDIKKYLQVNHTAIFTKLFVIAIFSIFAVIVSSKYLVLSVVDIAKFLSISEELIAMSVIAFGTSIPELAVTITSAKKGLSDILIGNIIGSNISNLLLVGGVAALITPLTITPFTLWFIMPFMLLITLLFKNYIKTKWIGRVLEGLILLFFYAIFIFIIILTSGI
jgi:cation:H+ antiporter